MSEGRERIRVSISTGELERRWAAVRSAMEDRKIDVLVMQNSEEEISLKDRLSERMRP
jgi:hypothetical protein